MVMERLTTCWQSVSNIMYTSLKCRCVLSWLTVQTPYLHDIRTIFLAKNKLCEALSTWGNLLLLFLRNLRMKAKNSPAHGHHLCLLLINSAILHENNGVFSGGENWRVFLKDNIFCTMGFRGW